MKIITPYIAAPMSDENELPNPRMVHSVPLWDACRVFDVISLLSITEKFCYKLKIDTFIPGQISFLIWL